MINLKAYALKKYYVQLRIYIYIQFWEREKRKKIFSWFYINLLMKIKLNEIKNLHNNKYS